MSCHFCPRPAELFTQPPLCERHIEMVMLRANMERSGIAFTPQHAARELLRQALADLVLEILDGALAAREA